VRRLKKATKCWAFVQRAFAEQVVAREDAFALVPPVLDLRDASRRYRGGPDRRSS